MANLRIHTDEGWAVLPLGCPSLYWPAPLEGPAPLAGETTPAQTTASLLQVGPEWSKKWVLLTASEAVRINGAPVPLGIRVLDDQDEVCLGPGFGGRLFFSAEEQAQVESFPGLGRPAECPRCTKPLLPGQPAVRCPNPECGVWVHQMPERQCWLYTEACPTCSGSTSLDAEFSFAPEEF